MRQSQLSHTLKKIECHVFTTLNLFKNNVVTRNVHLALHYWQDMTKKWKPSTGGTAIFYSKPNYVILSLLVTNAIHFPATGV